MDRITNILYTDFFKHPNCTLHNAKRNRNASCGLYKWQQHRTERAFYHASHLYKVRCFGLDAVFRYDDVECRVQWIWLNRLAFWNERLHLRRELLYDPKEDTCFGCGSRDLRYKRAKMCCESVNCTTVEEIHLAWILVLGVS